MSGKDKFFNRELSWIEFNARVLHESCRTELPLLERLQFLSIVTSNFNEFFQVRVAAIKRLIQQNPTEKDVSGLTPAKTLTCISKRCHEILDKHQNVLKNGIIPALATEGYVYTKPENFSFQQKEFAQKFFKDEILPLLTPLRTDSQDFPHISNLSLHAAFLLKPISGIKPMSEEFALKKGKPSIALVQIPTGIHRIVWLPSNGKTKPFTTVETLIQEYGTMLFPGFSVAEQMLFSITRDADFAVDEDAGSNFIHAMKEVLDQRQSSFAVRLTGDNSSETILKFLTSATHLSSTDIYICDEYIEPQTLMEIGDLEETESLKFESWQHFYPTSLPKEKPYWEVLKQHDVLLHVPYETYQPVVKFISDAADDANVISIKMTLYRTGRDSPIVSALERAARNGKQVTVFVELKARFDEERNMEWASRLEKAGVIVIFGIVNLKVHAKILMIIRREETSIRRYVHLATGNYNPKTAKLYSDLSIFTANPEIAQDATLFFNIITGYTALQTMSCLSMAPVNIKSNILSMINREIELSTPDNPGLIIAKMNSLTHEEVISALYKASRAGVKVMLNIRGICMLVPGVPEMSENIKVISIVDRYLEHERVFYFKNNGSPEMYLSSADWMTRNLDRRIELMFPVLDKDVFKDVKEALDTYFDSTQNVHILQSDGTWTPGTTEPHKSPKRAQEVLYKKYKSREEKASKAPKLEFVVRRKN